MPPSDNETPSEIWEETWKRVDRFLPDLFREVFPEHKAPPAERKEVAGQEETSIPTREAPRQKELGTEKSVDQGTSKQ